MQKNSYKKKVHSYWGPPQEEGKSKINNLTLHLKELKSEQTTYKVNREEIIRTRVDISKIVTKKNQKNKNNQPNKNNRKDWGN